MAPITFNGQEYDSPDAMPPDVRQLYELASSVLADKDGDGVPDLLEGQAGSTGARIMQTSVFMADGKVYTKLEDLPPEARQRYAQAMERLGVESGAMDDLLAAAAPALQQAQPSNQPPHVTVIGEGGRLPYIWLLVGVVVLLAGVLVYMLAP